MTASEHPSNHHPDNPRPLSPGQAHRAPKCTCGSEPEAWGCAACADKDDPLPKPVICPSCDCPTLNTSGWCLRCTALFAGFERECSDIRPPMQATPILCTYCHARATRFWAGICDVCDEAGA